MSIHCPAQKGFAIYYASKLEELSQYLVEVRPPSSSGCPASGKMHSAIESKLASAAASGPAGPVGPRHRSTLARCRSQRRAPRRVAVAAKKLAHSLVHKKVKAAIGLDQPTCWPAAPPDRGRKAEVLHRARHRHPRVYGQSESAGASTISVRGAARLSSVGRPIEAGRPHCRTARSGARPADLQWLCRQPRRHGRHAARRLAGIGRPGPFRQRDGYLYITGRKEGPTHHLGWQGTSRRPISEADLMTIPLVEHAVVCGDGKHYLSALLTLNPEAVRDLAPAITSALSSWAANNCASSPRCWRVAARHRPAQRVMPGWRTSTKFHHPALVDHRRGNWRRR